MKVDLLEGPNMVLLISNPLSKAATTVNFPSPSGTDHVLFLFIFSQILYSMFDFTYSTCVVCQTLNKGHIVVIEIWTNLIKVRTEISSSSSSSSFFRDRLLKLDACNILYFFISISCLMDYVMCDAKLSILSASWEVLLGKKRVLNVIIKL